jgi:shikimate dehydrogenase
MHNAAFACLGLEYAYLAFDTNEDNLEDVVKAMRVLKVRGFNVTMPNKKNVLPLLDEVTPEARMIGAVNTVLQENGRLIGYNTDGRGYVHALLETGVAVAGKRILLAGAGGAARSVTVQLAVDGAAEIVILNRTLSRAEAICSVIQKNVPACRVQALNLDEGTLRQRLRETDIFINTTALGMHPYEDQSVVTSPEMLHGDLIVSDVIYKPSKTRLLKIAEQAGCKTMNGLGMMIWQGAEAFKIWTGVDMPVDYIKNEVFSE